MKLMDKAKIEEAFRLLGERLAEERLTHDVSEGFRSVLKSMYEQLGYRDAAGRV